MPIWGYPIFDHLKRTLKSYKPEEVKQKVKVLEAMQLGVGAQGSGKNADTPEDKTVHVEHFLKEIRNRQAGRASIFSSTKTAKLFDHKNTRKQKKEPNIQTLSSYLTDKARLPGCKLHNNGRSFFERVMSTRDVPWMLAAIKSFDADQQQALIDKVAENYKPSTMASGPSLKLHNILKVESEATKEVKVKRIESFLTGLQSNKTKKNATRFRMLDVINNAVADVVNDRAASSTPSVK